MALSLQEAADQAGTSKVDIWRAIQAGSLPAHKNGDGGFAIDPAELFRVFERPAPSSRSRRRQKRRKPWGDPKRAPRRKRPQRTT